MLRRTALRSPLCRAFSVLALAFLVGAGCSGGDGTSTDARATIYCDEVTPCRDATLNYCDLTGQYPESQGMPNTCIADPALRECNNEEDCPDAAEPYCTSSGRCVSCLNFSHCTAETPLCSLSENRCVGCRQGQDGDQVCNAIDPLQPYCSATGSCAACIANDNCDVVTQPICDEASFTCRGCQAGECDTGTCNESNGVCESA